MVENQTAFSESSQNFHNASSVGTYLHILTHTTLPVFQTCSDCAVKARRVVRAPNTSGTVSEHRADHTYNISEAHQKRIRDEKVRANLRLYFFNHSHGTYHGVVRHHEPAQGKRCSFPEFVRKFDQNSVRNSGKPHDGLGGHGGIILQSTNHPTGLVWSACKHQLVFYR